MAVERHQMRRNKVDGYVKHPLNVRIAQTLRDALSDAAREAGRTVTQEVEHRLSQSLSDPVAQEHSRPAKAGEYVGFRASADLKRRLQASADAAGRSLSTEAQFRLERSYRDESLLAALMVGIALGQSTGPSHG